MVRTVDLGVGTGCAWLASHARAQRAAREVGPAEVAFFIICNCQAALDVIGGKRDDVVAFGRGGADESYIVFLMKYSVCS